MCMWVYSQSAVARNATIATSETRSRKHFTRIIVAHPEYLLNRALAVNVMHLALYRWLYSMNG